MSLAPVTAQLSAPYVTSAGSQIFDQRTGGAR
jgi:hypothetical protein